MSLQLIAKIGELAPNPDCVYRVLEDLLPHCNVPGDVTERTWLSVQLSACEFDAAGIEYPPSCNNFDTLMDCTSYLESKPTWWTTFSGNYRHISTICNEHRSQYEVQNIVHLYQNISRMMFSHQNCAEEALDLAQSRFDQAVQSAAGWSSSMADLSEKLSELYQNLSSTNNVAQAIPAAVNNFSGGLDVVSEKSASVQADLRDTLAVTADLASAISIMQGQILDSHNSLKVYQDELLEFGSTMRSLNNASLDLVLVNEKLSGKLSKNLEALDMFGDRQKSLISELDGAVESTAQTMTAAASQLNQAMSKIKIYMGLLSSMMRGVHFLAYLFVAVAVTKIVGLTWPRSAQNELDAAFY